MLGSFLYEKKGEIMKILSIDASTSSTGWGIFNEKKLVSYGCIKAKDGRDWRERIADMIDELDKIIKENKGIERIYVEDVPLNSRNPMTLKMLSVLQGALLGMAIGNKIYIDFVLPSIWRKSADLFDGTREGTKRAEMKKKSIELANKTFGLDLIYKSPSSKKNQDDEADAINLGSAMQGIYVIKEKKVIGKKVKV